MERPERSETSARVQVVTFFLFWKLVGPIEKLNLVEVSPCR